MFFYFKRIDAVHLIFCEIKKITRSKSNKLKEIEQLEKKLNKNNENQGRRKHGA